MPNIPSATSVSMSPSALTASWARADKLVENDASASVTRFHRLEAVHRVGQALADIAAADAVVVDLQRRRFDLRPDGLRIGAPGQIANFALQPVDVEIGAVDQTVAIRANPRGRSAVYRARTQARADPRQKLIFRGRNQPLAQVFVAGQHDQRDAPLPVSAAVVGQLARHHVDEGGSVVKPGGLVARAPAEAAIPGRRRADAHGEKVVSVQILKLVAGHRQRRCRAGRAVQLQRRRLDPLAPRGAGEQRAQRTALTGNDDVFQRLADEIFRRQPQKRFNGARRVNDAPVAIEFEEQIAPAEGQSDEAVAFGAKRGCRGTRGGRGGRCQHHDLAK